MEKITFNLTQLIEESEASGERWITPSPETFRSLKDSFDELIEDTYYEVTVSKNDTHIWFAFDYGKPNPIDNHLTNVKTGRKKENPRTKEQAELIQQLFALYYFGNNTLYISNFKKINVFLNMLQKNLSKKFIFKSFFKSQDEIISILKQIEEISFTDTKTLFDQNSPERKALVDLTGTGAPDKFTLTAKYKSHDIINFIIKLLNKESGKEKTNLTIKGVNEKGFKCIFNMNYLVQKMPVDCNKEENGKYNSLEVKNNLLNEIMKNER